MARTQTRRERVRRLVAAQAPWQHPRFRIWHLLGLLLAAVLGWLAIRAPGVLADVAAYPVADWQAFVLARGTIILLAVYALVFVRSYHPLTGLGLLATVVGLSLRIGLGQVTQEPLTAGYLALLLALLVPPVRVIARPNDTDRLRAYLEGERHGQ